MLKIVSKISYKLSINAIYVLFSIVADQLLSPVEFGKFSILLALQILIFNFVDIFNFKYLLGEFSSPLRKIQLKKFFSFKLLWGWLFIGLLTCLYIFYNISFFIVIILFLINYLQLLSSTLATYIFSNENDSKLLVSNGLGFIMSALYISIFYFIEKSFSLEVLFIAILIYRVSELFYLYFIGFSGLKLRISHIDTSIKKKDFKKSFSFYLQIIVSIGGAKLTIIYLPLILSYNDISIIATYEYVVAIPLFFLSVLTMSTYSKLVHNQSMLIANIKKYQLFIRKYYLKASLVIVFFIIIQTLYIVYDKQSLYPYIGFLIIHDILLVATSIQGYILFFWKMNKIVIILSFMVLFIKNILILIFITSYGLYGFFIASLIVELVVLVYIHIKVSQKVKILSNDSKGSAK